MHHPPSSRSVFSWTWARLRHYHNSKNLPCVFIRSTDTFQSAAMEISLSSTLETPDGQNDTSDATNSSKTMMKKLRLPAFGVNRSTKTPFDLFSWAWLFDCNFHRSPYVIAPFLAWRTNVKRLFPTGTYCCTTEVIILIFSDMCSFLKKKMHPMASYFRSLVTYVSKKVFKNQ